MRFQGKTGEEKGHPKKDVLVLLYLEAFLMLKKRLT